MSVELLVILGSATPPGRLRRALEETVVRAGADTQARLIDLAQLDIAPADGRPPAELGDDTASVLEAIADAGAVVLATPVYRGSMTGVLKNLLDHVPVEALEGKTVGIVAMGAGPHHFLGAERHLRDVLAFFGAHVCPVAVYLTSADFQDGVPGKPAAAELDALVAELTALADATKGPRALGPRPLGARR